MQRIILAFIPAFELTQPGQALSVDATGQSVNGFSRKSRQSAGRHHLSRSSYLADVSLIRIEFYYFGFHRQKSKIYTNNCQETTFGCLPERDFDMSFASGVLRKNSRNPGIFIN
jgi:hypothetical protein